MISVPTPARLEAAAPGRTEQRLRMEQYLRRRERRTTGATTTDLLLATSRSSSVTPIGSLRDLLYPKQEHYRDGVGELAKLLLADKQGSVGSLTALVMRPTIERFAPT
jgi:hypothetical protein